MLAIHPAGLANLTSTSELVQRLSYLTFPDIIEFSMHIC